MGATCGASRCTRRRGSWLRAAADEILVSELTRGSPASGLAVRGSRARRAQGPRRRVAPVRFVGPSDERASAHPRRRRGRRSARADHARAPALRARLQGHLRAVDRGRARAARGAPRARRRGRNRAGGSRDEELKGERAPRARPRPPSAREARAADPVGRLGGRGDRGRDPHRDGARPHRLLRAQAVEHAGRALPPARLGVPAGVAAAERPGPAGAHGRRGPVVVPRLRAAEPAGAKRRAARVPRARLRRGRRRSCSVRPGRRRRSGRDPARRVRARRSARRGPRASTERACGPSSTTPGRSTS